MPSQEPSGLEPQCLALLVCDHVHVDPVSGRHTILGTFDAVEAAEFPFIFPKLCVYVAVGDGRGVTPILLQMVDVDEEYEPVWTYDAEVDLTDPMTVQEIGVEIQDARFNRPGTYRLQLIASNATIIERGFYVQLAEPLEE